MSRQESPRFIERNASTYSHRYISSKNFYNDKKEVVFSGTNKKYSGKIPDDLYCNPLKYEATFKYIKGYKCDFIYTFVIQNEGKKLDLEFISPSTLTLREKVVVYKGSGTRYLGDLPDDFDSKPEKYQAVYRKGELYTFTIKDGKSDSVNLEIIKAGNLAKRKYKVVLAGSVVEYKKDLPHDLDTNPEKYSLIRDERGMIHYFTIYNEDGSKVNLEFIIASKLSARRKKLKVEEEPKMLVDDASPVGFASQDLPPPPIYFNDKKQSPVKLLSDSSAKIPSKHSQFLMNGIGNTAKRSASCRCCLFGNSDAIGDGGTSPKKSLTC